MLIKQINFTATSHSTYYATFSLDNDGRRTNPPLPVAANRMRSACACWSLVKRVKLGRRGSSAAGMVVEPGTCVVPKGPDKLDDAGAPVPYSEDTVPTVFAPYMLPIPMPAPPPLLLPAVAPETVADPTPAM